VGVAIRLLDAFSTPSLAAEMNYGRGFSGGRVARLEKLAHNQNLVTPHADQVIHLDGNKPESSVAMVQH